MNNIHDINQCYNCVISEPTFYVLKYKRKHENYFEETETNLKRSIFNIIFIDIAKSSTYLLTFNNTLYLSIFKRYHSNNFNFKEIKPCSKKLSSSQYAATKVLNSNVCTSRQSI